MDKLQVCEIRISEVDVQNYYLSYLNRMMSSLQSVEFTNYEKMNLGNSDGLAHWVDLTHRANASGNAIYFIGNGASATMSSHMSADACKNGKLRARCLNDIALVTAIANDIDFKSVFSLQLERYAHKGDLLITVSSSGNSANVIQAIEVAKRLGMMVVTLSGMTPDNKSRALGDLNVYVPADKYGIIETGHQGILHCWLDCYLNSIGVDM